MAVSLPIEDVASAADIMFLLLFLQVNVAAIRIRNMFGKELDYGYRMPFFPVTPLLGIISMLFLVIYMFNYSPKGWFAAIIWIIIGSMVYYGYSLGKEKVEKGKIARQISPGDYHVIVPISKLMNVEPLITVAAAIARPHNSEVIALHVIAVPRQTFLETGHQFIKDSEIIFEKAISKGKELGVEVRKKIVVSHKISEAILDVAKSGKSNLILLGGTEKLLRGKIKQSIPQIVMRYAECDVGVLFPKNFKEIKRILVPLGLGEHDYRVKFAEKLMDFFDAKLTILTVIEDHKQVEPARKKQQEVARLLNRSVSFDIEVSYSVVDKIIERSEDYDLIIIGPSTEWIMHDFLFGSVSDKIFRDARCSVLILKEPEPHAETWIDLIYDKLTK
jgi:nucleotide-binding universal stress UspA family protein